MNTPHKHITASGIGITLAVALLGLSAPAWAASHGAHGGHGSHGAHAAAGGEKVSEFVDAEVRRVDVDRGRITLRHGEIKALEMSPMTMVFRVDDKALLSGLSGGERVQVRVTERQGAYVVVELRKLP